MNKPKMKRGGGVRLEDAPPKNKRHNPKPKRFLSTWRVGSRVEAERLGTGRIIAASGRPKRVTIIWDKSPKPIIYDPTDLELFRIKLCLPTSTSAQESVQDSPTQRSRSLDLAWLDCANETNGAKTSSDSDTPTVTSNETLKPSITTDTKDKSTSSPPLPPVLQPEPSFSQNKDIDLSNLFLLEMRFLLTKEGGRKSSQQILDSTSLSELLKLEVFLVWLQPTNTPSTPNGNHQDAKKDQMEFGNTTENLANLSGSMPKTSPKTAVWVKFYQKNNTQTEALIFGGSSEDIWLMDGEVQENLVLGQDTESESVAHMTKLTILSNELNDASIPTQSTTEALLNLKSTATNSVTFWKNLAQELEERPSQVNSYHLIKSQAIHCLKDGHQVMDTLSRSAKIAGVSESQQLASLWQWAWLYLPKEATELWQESKSVKSQRKKSLKGGKSTNKIFGLFQSPEITVQPLSKVITDGSKLKVTNALALELSTTLESLKTNLILQTELLSITANLSVSKVKGSVQTTKETVSQHSQERSLKSSPDTSALRTSQDCSTVPTDPDTSTNIFHIYSDNLPSSGTMRNGYVSAQDTLALPSLDDGYCWLESPTALSATPGRRPPGLSRLENQLKEYGLIEKGQVLRPDFLLSSYNLPKTYLDPSDSRTAIQLHEDSERQLEIFSTPELQPSPSDESSICPACQTPLTEGGCGVCGWSGEKLLGDKQKCSSKVETRHGASLQSVKCSSKNASPSKKRRGKGEGSGCIYWRTVTRNGKDYQQAYYQWRSHGKQRTRYIPKKLLDQVLACEAQKLPVADILILLGDKQKCSSKKVEDSSAKCSSKNASPSKSRRGKGEGSGSIHCKPIKRGEKDYPQYWYHYEIWQDGDRVLKKTKYIPKRLLSEVQQLDQQKAPVREILKLLGVI